MDLRGTICVSFKKQLSQLVGSDTAPINGRWRRSIALQISLCTPASRKLLASSLWRAKRAELRSPEFEEATWIELFFQIRLIGRARILLNRSPLLFSK